MFGGIADFRIDLPSWLDVEEDRRKASRLIGLIGTLSTKDLVAEVFRQRPGWSESDIERRTRGILEGPTRFTRELDGWLRPATTGRLPFLDLGCGAGPLLAAAARLGRSAVGIDVSLEWLVVARQLILDAGGRPNLAAALGEALPLADQSVGGVVSLDVIEHVDEQDAYLRQIGRVLAVGGVAAIATPNRYSLSAEPHVSIWGVGWLPRAWQERYVRLRGGKSYAHCRLLSVVELRRMLRTSAGLEPRILLGEVSQEEIAGFQAIKAWLAKVYNRLLLIRPARAALIWVCPFFRTLATKGRA
ncbi:MAG TPA: class I SAM-dependent methyltransferase [Vicinamibacterales bacterium]|nr:class I SAM-dependent methyltransferase [Vicinamibacterales bacterium]